jgi:hypothetical protein
MTDIIYDTPINYSNKIYALMTKMQGKNNYLESSKTQPTIPSNKTPGYKIFDPSVFKADKNQLDLSIFNQVFANNLLSEQEKKFYLLQKFLLELANNDYNQVSNITERYTINAQHIVDLMKIKKSNKENKLVYLIPNNALGKSNFWLSLFFIQLTQTILKPDYMIDHVKRLSDINNEIKINFPDSDNYNYIVVISDDISYSGSQLSESTFIQAPFISKNVTVFLNLVGYSEVAKARIEKEKFVNNRICSLEFGRGCKYPLNKLSAKFNEKNNTNNVLYQKSLIDFPMLHAETNVRMMSSLILNDVFYLIKKGDKLLLKSNLFNYYKFYESHKKKENNNGSIQYLSIKYPDFYSTIENMCKFTRLQNVAIFRIDKLIHYLNLPNMTALDKIDWLANKIIEKNLWTDIYLGEDIVIDFDLIDKFICSSDPDLPIIPNSFDHKLIKLFTKTNKNKETNSLTNELTNTFTKKFDDRQYNNLILSKFVNLNNKISKFNKKHLLEFVMPKSLYQTAQTSKYIIKNCIKEKDIIEPHIDSGYYCNNFCSLNFYKKINWN